MEPNWLNPREDRAWRSFMHAHHQLVAHLNRGLQESGLSGADYEVLAVLSALDGDRMPSHELRNALGWEKTRLSHQVRRMQTDGLISREPNPGDARSTMVCLLPAGRAATGFVFEITVHASGAVRVRVKRPFRSGWSKHGNAMSASIGTKSV